MIQVALPCPLPPAQINDVLAAAAAAEQEKSLKVLHIMRQLRQQHIERIVEAAQMHFSQANARVETISKELSEAVLRLRQSNLNARFNRSLSLDISSNA